MIGVCSRLGLILLCTSGCLPRGLPYKKPSIRASGELAARGSVRVALDPFTGTFQLPGQLPNAVTEMVKTQDEDSIWALAHCNCLPNIKADIFKSYAVSHGSMPQVLVPRVREEVRKDKSLQLLLKLPDALAAVLRKLVAKDENINSKVQENLSLKIEKVTKTKLSKDIDFSFDHFLVSNGDYTGFKTRDLTARWNLVFSASNFWRNQPAMAFDNHGLQVLESIRVLSEWKYIFGLDTNTKGGHYGGLTVDTDLVDPALKRFDPRTEPEGQRMISGTYSVKLPVDADAVELVVNAREEWTRVAAPPTIIEQAMAWNAAALAFAQVRPDRRSSSTEDLFGDEEELLPSTTHMLPLAFLRAIQGLLEKRFLDKDARMIVNLGDPQDKVDLKVLARLGRSLYSWVSVLKDLDNAQIAPASLQNLKDAPDKLTNALRLVQLVIVREQYLTDFGTQPTADIAEAIALLADAGTTLIRSPLLQEAVVDAFHRLVKERIAGAWETNAQKPLTLTELLWFYSAASSVNRYSPEIHQAPWLPALVKNLEAKLGIREAAPWVQ